MYRTYGDKAGPLGRFTTTKPAITQAETRKSLALLPEWHNSIEREVTIKIPKGTKLNIGKVGPQVSRIDGRCYPGGADQIMIVGRWPKDWIVNDREVMK